MLFAALIWVGVFVVAVVVGALPAPRDRNDR